MELSLRMHGLTRFHLISHSCLRALIDPRLDFVNLTPIEVRKFNQLDCHERQFKLDSKDCLVNDDNEAVRLLRTR